MSDSRMFSIFTLLLVVPASLRDKHNIPSLLARGGVFDFDSVHGATPFRCCRSSRMEESLFWRFEGIMMCLTVVLVLVVIARQRTLDHLASEKVRRQILSI